ncbi:MAG: enoyl-[acyl-carrier-protein] reductase FabK [Clostridiales bacterium]|jgi:enoyl-[acyl-carrier protein] reductase II|nr:MAG: enoyl-[acyl-carrier-protein] reductase FabK [Clostridiales bacterium]
MTETRITKLLGVEYPVLQGGMAWIADAELAAAVSNGGGVGLIAAGNAPADYVEEQIKKAKTLTDKPFGVNIMLLSPFAAEVCELVAREKVAVVTTGAGNPAAHISMWKDAGITVIPVVPSCALAKRMERYGADAVVAEGMESGGHIGELTTMALVPQVTDSVGIPVIAAGGIADGRGMAAAFMLGAEGVQIGTRFLVARECNVHQNYKDMVLKAKDTDTIATGRITGHPVRVLKNKLARRMKEIDLGGGTAEELEKLGAGALKAAAVDGDCSGGSVMAGQIAGLVKEEQTAAEIIREICGGAERLLGGKA